MKEYPRLRLLEAKTKIAVLMEANPKNKFLQRIGDSVIEDIAAAIVFDGLGGKDDKDALPELSDTLESPEKAILRDEQQKVSRAAKSLAKTE